MTLWCNKRIIYHYINLIPKIKLEKSKIFFSSFNPFPINHFVTKFHFDTTQMYLYPPIPVHSATQYHEIIVDNMWIVSPRLVCPTDYIPPLFIPVVPQGQQRRDK